MNKFNILTLSLFLTTLFSSCTNDIPNTNSTLIEMDDQQMKEYFRLCLGLNEYFVSAEILKQPDFHGSDRYFAELISDRLISAKATVLNKNLSVDTSYIIPLENEVKVKFKPRRVSYSSFGVIIDKRFVARQEYIGANLLDENPVSNIVLIQNASIIDKTDKVIVTELYFKIPIYNGNHVFGQLDIKDCDMNLISFVNRLQRNDNIFNDKFKQTILEHLH